MNARPIYSFPEPEKTSAWQKESTEERDRALARMGVDLRDVDADTAKKRTELIKAQMSPPGELGLPALLEEQRLKWGIPDGFFKAIALFDRIHVFPIDEYDNQDRLPGSVLFRPNVTKQKDLQEGHRGILLSAGLTAADQLMSHGIELGHIVVTNKNCPFARKGATIEGHPMWYLVMRAADLCGDETLQSHIREGHAQVTDIGDDGEYCHQVAYRDASGTLTVRKKKSVYVNDTW